MRKRAGFKLEQIPGITSRLLWRAVFLEGKDYDESIHFHVFREPDAEGFIVGRVI
jgi:hypothetical protein